MYIVRIQTDIEARERETESAERQAWQPALLSWFAQTLKSWSFIHSFISIQPYRPGWQEPEPSHVTGVALAHCILGKFLEVVCYCFPPPLDVPTFASRCLYVRKNARDPSSERWNCGREICPVILPKFRLPYGTEDFTSPPKEGVLRIFFSITY